MDNSSFALGAGIGLIIGLTLGLAICTFLKKEPPQTVKTEPEGAMYTYDDQNRLQSVIPISKVIK